MNIIRTPVMELTVIPAICYKIKLKSGGAGLKIFRLDNDNTAAFTLDKATGYVVPYGPVEAELFPEAAINEALELTEGLPYSARGKVKITSFEVPADEEEIAQESSDEIDITASDEYVAIVERYTDEKGSFSNKLMNKDFIQFASKSDTVAKMAANHALEEDILVFIVKSRATFLSGKKESLPDEDVLRLIQALDDMGTRGAFKDLKSYIRRILGRK